MQSVDSLCIVLPSKARESDVIDRALLNGWSIMSGFINQLLDNIPDDELQQIKALRRVADIARNLWKTEPGSPDLDLLAEKAGDAARVEANRTPLGESGLLEFFCSVVQTQGLRSTLIIQCLRIIGNSSADQGQ